MLLYGQSYAFIARVSSQMVPVELATVCLALKQQSKVYAVCHYRGHTIEAGAAHVTRGGKDWDTVKPLHKWFKHLHRVLLMDDDAYKVFL